MKKSMKFTAAASLVAALAINVGPALAQTWTARTLDQVQETLAQSTDGVYVIQWGDTLHTIAKATGYSVADLAVINEVQDIHTIQAGAVLYFDQAQNSVTYVEASQDLVATYELPEETYVLDTTEEWVAPETQLVATNQAQETQVDQVTEWVAPETTQAVVEEVTEWVTPVVEETTQALVVEETQAPVVEATTQALVVEETQAPVVEATTQAPVVEETQAPVVEETTQAPVVETTQAPVVEATTVAATAGTNQYGGIISEAKEWIAMKESGGNYDIWNPSGKYYGRYQLTVSYLNGDLSPENQERVADEYVLNRYGSWEAAKEFWLQNNWY
ncbi:TPA: LysM peptidoglycan-binding domain-containing protein [Streptococcus suis]